MRIQLALVVSSGNTAAFEQAARTLFGVKLCWVTYEREDDIRGQVRRLLDVRQVDGVLLGPLPYDRCRDLLPPDLPVAVTRPGPVELALTYARTLRAGWSPTPVSVDTFEERTVREVGEALGLSPEGIRCLPYASGQSSDDIIAFHTGSAADLGDCYVITGRTSVAHGLSGKLPLQHVSATPSTICTALHELALRAQSRRKGELQFAAGVFTLGSAGSTHDVDRDRAALKYALLNTPAFADAWIEERGRHDVVVLAHKALLERATYGWSSAPVVDTAKAHIGSMLAVGFGLGPSARKCLSLADQAARRAKQDGTSCAYLVGDDGLIIGPLGGEAEPLRYTYREHSALPEDLARHVGLSALTLSRLAAVDRKHSTRPLSAVELAEALGITNQSARRLLRTLVTHDLATHTGSAQNRRRGRPLRLYRLRINEYLADAEKQRSEDASDGTHSRGAAGSRSSASHTKASERRKK